jgi:hypothetical protein
MADKQFRLAGSFQRDICMLSCHPAAEEKTRQHPDAYHDNDQRPQDRTHIDVQNIQIAKQEQAAGQDQNNPPENRIASHN